MNVPRCEQQESGVTPGQHGVIFVHYTPERHIPNHEGWLLMNPWEKSLESDKGENPVHLSSVCDILQLKQHRHAVLADVLCDFLSSPEMCHTDGFAPMLLAHLTCILIFRYIVFDLLPLWALLNSQSVLKVYSNLQLTVHFITDWLKAANLYSIIRLSISPQFSGDGFTAIFP